MSHSVCLSSQAFRTVPFVLALFLAGAQPALAQVYKCKGADGKLQLSDRPCVGAKSSEVVPDKWGSVSAEDRIAAQQRAARMQQSADAIDAERASAKQESAAAASSAPPPAPALSTDHIRDCTRNVDRQLLTDEQRVRLVAACKSAPALTKEEEQTAEGCRRWVDRQLLSGEEKARRMAQCSGAAVPEPTQQVKKPDVGKGAAAGGPMGTLHCNGAGCSDASGNWYKKKMNGDFAGPNGACYVRNGHMHCP